MSWSTPRTWVTGELVTASIMNSAVRDNFNQTAPAVVTTNGDIVYATGANALARRGIGSAGQILTVSGGVPVWANPSLTIATTITVTDSSTNTVTNVLTLSHDSSGTPAANYGTGLLFQGQDSTTADQNMARVQTYWTTATHASRTSAVDIQVVNNAGALATVATFSPTGLGIGLSPSYTLDVSGQARISSNVGIGTAPAASFGVGLAMTITASGAVARGYASAATLTAAANNDLLAHFHANGSVNIGSFTGTTQVGLYVEALSGAASNYAIYTNGTTQSYFGGNVGVNNSTPNLGGLGTTVTISHATAQGGLELTSSRPDSDAVVTGRIDTFYTTNSANHKNIASIYFGSNGSTANQRGGYVAFLTKADASTALTERVRVDCHGGLLVGGTTNTSASASVIAQNASDYTPYQSYRTGSAADAKIWDWLHLATSYNLRAVNDAYSTAEYAYSITRSGRTVTGHTWYVNSQTTALSIDSSGNLIQAGGYTKTPYIRQAPTSLGSVTNGSNTTMFTTATGDAGVVYIFSYNAGSSAVAHAAFPWHNSNGTLTVGAAIYDSSGGTITAVVSGTNIQFHNGTGGNIIASYSRFDAAVPTS